MVRQGKYTKKVTRVTKVKRSLKRTWRWFKKLSKKKKALLIATPILAFLILTPIFTYIYYYNDIADQERLMNRNNTGIVLTDRDGKVIYSVGRAEHRKMVPLNNISEDLQHALIASEDRDFYNHKGFSITGIMRAVYGTVTSQQSYGGGSTLTQQLAKNTLLTADYSYIRKYQELAISIAIEQRYSKEDILQMYLNSVFFGGTNFGIEEAARYYFDKSPRELDLAESAMLIGILPSPNAYSPTLGNPKYAKERQEYVLDRMEQDGYITAEQEAAALKQKLRYAPTSSEESIGEAPHFAQAVLNELYEKYGGGGDNAQEKVMRAGYQVRTTLDLKLQQSLEQNIRNHLPYIEAFGGSNAAGVAIDPTTGHVRALVGSADWKNKDWGEVNMVTTPRQPGSSFKPIYYAEALAQGIITPATILHDKPTDFGGYKPENADRGYRGNISVRSSISQSLNIPSVEVLKMLGIDKAVEAANRMGIAIDPNKNYGLSLALGTAEAPLMQMTNAYAAFANQGQQYPTTTIEQIKDKYSKQIYTANQTSKEVITKQGAYLISSILSDNNARAPIFGGSLTVPGHTAAVKTGTTDDNRDAWTIGYTPQLAVGVWVGNNNNAVMQNGGSGMAGPIWVNTMQAALSGTQNVAFSVPDGVIQKPVCYGSGGLASGPGTNTYNEYFLASALPSNTCTAQVKTETNDDKNQQKKPDTDQKKDEDETPAGGDTPDTDTPEDPTDGTDPGVDDGEPADGNPGGGTLPDQGGVVTP